MVAAPRLGKKQNVLEHGLDEKFPNLLKAAVIYGPNASGKSALVSAMGILPMIIGRGPEYFGRHLPISPFRFDASLTAEPSFFEIHFIQQGLRYQYEVAMTVERIVEEKLVVYPKGREQLLFHRYSSSKTVGEKYEFGPIFEGGTELRNAWVNLTGPRVLFLGQAVRNSNESLTQLRLPYDWIAAMYPMQKDSLSEWAESSEELVGDHEEFCDELAEFLRTVDVPVSEIRVEKFTAPMRNSKTKNSAFEEESETQRTIYTHTTDLGSAEFDSYEESDGTRNLIGFWLPYSIMIDRVKPSFKLLIVDELDSSLHPSIVSALVSRHMNSGGNGQLIFTTHDTRLMKENILRRDQFWVTERDSNGATQLRSIHDFSGREGEDVEKRYFEGRYRGLPILPRGME